MLPHLVYHTEHNLWQQIVGHEKKDSSNFNRKNNEFVFSPERLDTNLEKLQYIKLKRNYYSKLLPKYLNNV